MPSVSIRAVPSGKTSTSFAVKSVSVADDDAHSLTSIGPVTSIGDVERRGRVDEHVRATLQSRWSVGIRE